MGQLLDLLLGRGENDRLGLRRPGEHLADDPQLLALVTDISALFDRFVGLRNGDIDLGRIVQNLLGHLPDLGRQRRGEHQRLPRFGHIGDDLHNVVVKTHVEHTVRLVQNQIIHVREIDAAVHKVRNQAPRRGDHHIGTHLQTALLLVPAAAVAAAVDHGGRDGHIVGKALELHVDLLGQFARGHDDDRLHDVLLIAFEQQPVQQRQRIGSRLARTGLSAGDNIAPLQDDRNGLLLHGRHLLKIHGVDAVQHLVFQIEFVKSHTMRFFFNYYTSNGRVLSINSPCNVADEEAVTRTRT